MSGRSRYIRRVREVDHTGWLLIRKLDATWHGKVRKDRPLQLTVGPALRDRAREQWQAVNRWTD